MTKHMGIVAGSSEGAALCYRTICLEAQVTQPVAAFVPFVRSGKLLFVSGHLAKIDGKP